MKFPSGHSPSEVVVLGAGPTGLGVGLGLVSHGDHRPVTIVERDDRPGGLAGSFSWNGHTVDQGPHRLSPNIDFVRVLAEELLGPDLLRLKSRHGVQINGKCYQFPPRVIDWLPPPSAWLLGRLVGSFCASKAAWVTRRFRADDFESMAVRKFGRRFYELVLRPMSGKVWADPDRIDPAFVDQRFSLIRPFEVAKRLLLPRQELNPATFYYPRRGFQQLWDCLADYLGRDGERILYQTEPSRIEVDGHRIARVHLKGPGGDRVLEGEDLVLVSTIPLTGLLGLLDGFPKEELVARAGRIRFRSMILVMFEFDRPQVLPFRTLVFPQSDFCFNRLYEQNQYSPDTVSPGKSVVVADLTLPREDPRMEWEEERLIDLVRADLEKLACVPEGRIVASGVRRIEYAYPVPDLESRRLMHGVLHELKRISNLWVMGRFGAGEYDNSDYALDAGVTLASMISGRLSKLDFLCHMNAKRGRSIVG
jgi:protoporphyrinogen oxidase